MTELISVNGKITPAAEATLPALDRGFLFGDNVFEVFVGFRGKILDVEEHLKRLRSSALNINLELPWSNEELAFELRSLAESIHSPKISLRLVVSRGNGLGLKVPANITPNKVIYVGTAPTEDPEIFRTGINVKRKALPTTERGGSIKTGNYLRSILALNKAQQEGSHDILWTNADGELTEASTANIFFIGRQGDGVEILTPSLQSGLLEGITRATVMRLLETASIPSRQQVIYADEIPRFDEAFLCSTVRGLVPIRQIDQHKLQTTRAQAVYHHIVRLFMAKAESELGFRPDWNTGELRRTQL